MISTVRSRAAVLVAALLATAAVAASRGQPAPRAVGERVASRAHAFPLTAVRLLDSPFRDAMARDQAYLLELDPDRLLHAFRLTAGLPTRAAPLGGWEAPDVELRGHTAGHYLSALALMYAATGDERFKDRGDAMVAALAGVQAALAAKGFRRGYLSAFPESFIDRVERRERVWAPYYTLHKMMAGLLDMYRLCGNRQALDVLVAQAGWVRGRMDRLTRAQQQAMLATEFGGMNDVLASLYAETGDPAHLRLAQAFDHDAIFEPLARGEDPLDMLHANTQIPKVIGAAREYEVTGDARYRDIATFFWDRVARGRSWANGGHSDGELFFAVDRFAQHLGVETAETCNTYNMLKLTRHLFQWAPSAGLMDFYERGLYNHILASQDPATGMMIYYCPLKPGAWRSYSTRDASFWCCVGTGLENHAKYADTIYFHDERGLYVNLFIPSELTWAARGLVLRQETRFPDEDTVRLRIVAGTTAPLTVRLRHPSWAVSGISVALNGVPQQVASTPGSYLSLVREWRTGDTIDLRLPMPLREEPLPGSPGTIALFAGPILLAGDLGEEGLTSAARYGPSAPPMATVPPVEVPAFVTADRSRLLDAIRSDPSRALTFTTSGLGRPRDVTLRPFNRLHDRRYSVYWTVQSPAEWAAAQARRAGDAARAVPASVDSVDAGSASSEQAHDFRGEQVTRPDFEGRLGRETRGGWFSYRLAVPPDAPVSLVCTYRGSEGRARIFDVLVDGKVVATETLAYHPTELRDVTYAVPPALTQGKRHVTVRFQPKPDAWTAWVLGVRVIRQTP